MTPPTQDVLLATRVGDVMLGLHAHPAYLERRGTPATLGDLSAHALVGFDTETPFLRTARSQFTSWSRDNFTHRSDSDLAQLALIRAGAGIGVCQMALAQRTPSLVQVLPGQWAFTLTTWVVMHDDLRTSPRCRVTFDALVQGLRRYTGTHASGA